MFEPEQLYNLAREHTHVLGSLIEIERFLAKRFEAMQDAIEALVLSVASGEPLLFIGPPGTGKSRLIRVFCVLTGLLKDEDQARSADYFEYLLTPFTEPGELFGFWNLAKAKDGVLVRESHLMMQNAKVVYLDEVFNGSSAILNSILTFMNERLFYDRNETKRVAMECLFGATNQVAETPELRALFDRFVIRCRVENAPSEPDSLQKMLAKGWQDTYGKPLENLDGAKTLFQNLKELRAAIRKANLGPVPRVDGAVPIYTVLAQLVGSARHHNLSEMSNRRLVKFAHVMLVHRLYQAVKEGKLTQADFERAPIGKHQLALLPRFFLDTDGDEQTVERMKREAYTLP